MGRPSHCCSKCSPPEVVCDVVGTDFVWSVKNAKTAVLYTTTDTIYIVLDENGDANGTISVVTGNPSQTSYSFRIDATNLCGSVTCKKDCSDFYCCSITADFQGCVDCDTSNIGAFPYTGVQCRKDTIRINWRVLRWNADWSNITVSLNGFNLAINPHRETPDGPFVVDGYFDIARCDLEEKYELLLSGTSACGLTLQVGNFNGPCCFPTYVSCIDRRNTLVVEANVADFEWTRYDEAESWATYVYFFKHHITKFKTTGLAAISGTYYFPLYCAAQNPPQATKRTVAMGPVEQYIGQYKLEYSIEAYDRSAPPNVLGVGLATDFYKEYNTFTADMYMTSCGNIYIKNRYLSTTSMSQSNNQLTTFSNEGPCGTVGSGGSLIDCGSNGAATWPPVSTCPFQSTFLQCGTNQGGISICSNPECGFDKYTYLNYSKPVSYSYYPIGGPLRTSNDSAIITTGIIRGYYGCV